MFENTDKTINENHAARLVNRAGQPGLTRYTVFITNGRDTEEIDVDAANREEAVRVAAVELRDYETGYRVSRVVSRSGLYL